MISKKLFPIIIFIYFFQYANERNLNYFNSQKVSKKNVLMHRPSIKKSVTQVIYCSKTLKFSHCNEIHISKANGYSLEQKWYCLRNLNIAYVRKFYAKLCFAQIHYTYAGGTSRDRRAYIVGFYREKQRKGHELFSWRRKFSQLKDLKTGNSTYIQD